MTILFNQAPDLLEDFKQFLPESAAQARAAAARQAAEDAAMLSNVRGDINYPVTGNQTHHTPKPDQNRMPPVGNFAPTPTASRENKRKRQEKHNAVPIPSIISGNHGVDLAARSSNTQPTNNLSKVSCFGFQVSFPIIFLGFSYGSIYLQCP